MGVGVHAVGVEAVWRKPVREERCHASLSDVPQLLL